jgi:hypothetical protein
VRFRSLSARESLLGARDCCLATLSRAWEGRNSGRDTGATPNVIEVTVWDISIHHFTPLLPLFSLTCFVKLLDDHEGK